MPIAREQAAAQLIAEIKAGRSLILAQNERIAALESQISAEQENSTSLSRSYEASKSEIMALRNANALLEKAIALHESTIGLLEQQRDKETRRAAKWKKRTVTVSTILILNFLTKLL